jgi:hypothetical protein
MGLPDIFGFKRRAEERRRREEQESRLRRARLLGTSGSPQSASSRSAWDDSLVNPASPSGMILSPLSPVSPSYGGSDHSSSDSCTASSSYSDSGSSCSGGDSGGGGGGD